MTDAKDSESRPAWKQWAILISGWVFIVLGILGLFLPFLQGILFLVIGLVLLAQVQHWPRRLLEKLKRRFPKLGGMVEKSEEKVKGWFGMK